MSSEALCLIYLTSQICTLQNALDRLHHLCSTDEQSFWLGLLQEVKVLQEGTQSAKIKVLVLQAPPLSSITIQFLVAKPCRFPYMPVRRDWIEPHDK